MQSPITEALFMATSITSSDITQSKQRITNIKQLVYSESLAILVGNQKSKLHKLFLLDNNKVRGCHIQ